MREDHEQLNMFSTVLHELVCSSVADTTPGGIMSALVFEIACVAYMSTSRSIDADKLVVDTEALLREAIKVVQEV